MREFYLKITVDDNEHNLGVKEEINKELSDLVTVLDNNSITVETGDITLVPSSYRKEIGIDQKQDRKKVFDV